MFSTYTVNEMTRETGYEREWQRRWKEAGTFETDPDPAREKYFINFPYPYINGLLHIGHALTLTRTDIMARYKRMMGCNVLLPFAFHATGSPIVAAAERVADGEPKQIAALEKMEIPAGIIPEFGDPEKWVRYFPGEAYNDIQDLGVSIDWRRKFITTSLNPYYDAFVRWQFRTLKERGYVVKGRHPVVWCVKDNSPVGDHARLEGEGEVPQEFTLLKFEFGDEVIVAATLRPETVYGQTNLWVDPEVEYARARVDGEVWIMSREAADKLVMQDHEVEIIGSVRGEELIGKEAIAPVIKRPIPILPSSFCDPTKGTGIVTSVPSDAPDDWMGLYDLRNQPELRDRFGLSEEFIMSIEPIPIIRSEGWGDLPAVSICEDMGILDQNDRKALEKAKKEIYRTGFYTGILTENADVWEGQRVEDVKDLIKEEMIANGEAILMYELSNSVVCRCLTPSVVKIVSDQWFLDYRNQEWKDQVRGALDYMTLLPENVRKQFEYVIGWLREWACTREVGLGTRLPWDEKWLIESLSDSTVYMSYYTISHHLEKDQVIAPDRITPDLFDYVFLGNGDPEELAGTYDIGKDVIESMREEFLYYYPFDLRISGKDLIQNHLSFCLFNHVALFDSELWPRGFSVNGLLQINGAKMSKSQGNFFTQRELIAKYGPDAVRLTLAYGREGIDDPNWDTAFAETIDRRLQSWREFVIANKEKARFDELCLDDVEDQDSIDPMDRWFASVIENTLSKVHEQMNDMNFRSALKIGYFDLQKALRWYQRRRDGDMHPDVLGRFIEVQSKVLAPIVPHIGEEIWKDLGHDEFISTSFYPRVWGYNISDETEGSEQVLVDLVDDIQEILKVTGIEPNRICIYTAEEWKWKAMDLAAYQITIGNRADVGSVMKELSAMDEFKPYMKVAAKFIGKTLPSLAKVGDDELKRYETILPEAEYLQSAVAFLERTYGAKVDVFEASDQERYDPKGKAGFAQPLRPAIYVE